ncbi:MAG: hypothetical protein ACTHKZ_02675 [Lysobacteraceae bacterium]
MDRGALTAMGDATTLPLRAPSTRTRLVAFLLSVVLPLACIGVALALHGVRWQPWPEDAHARAFRAMLGTAQPTFEGTVAVAVSLAVLLVAWGVIAWSLRRHRIELNGDRFTVVAGLHRDRLVLSELQLAQARIGRLGEHPEWKPWLKSNGIALPGFRGGWFRTRRWQRVFACLADGERVLWIPTTRKHALLLDAPQPQALLERLRGLAGAEMTPPRARR